MRRRQLFSLLGCGLLLALVSPGTAAQTAAQTEFPAAPALFSRVAVLGASASAGYGLRVELRAEVQLGDLLDCILLGEREPTLDLADGSLFQSPTRRAQATVKRALEARPSLVVAIDFLFWFGYSASWVRDKDRDAHLELGLGILDRLQCPILVGDLPNMSTALQGVGPFGGPLIEKHMIPSEEELVRLNARIVAWAAERERVVVVPMAKFMHDLQGNRELVVRGNRWGPDSLERLLQRDLLHPRVEGSIGLLLLALDRLVSAREDLPEGSIEWRVPVVLERLMQRTAPEREKALARDRRTAERRKRLRERIDAKKAEEDGEDD